MHDPPEEHTARREGKRKGNHFHPLCFDPPPAYFMEKLIEIIDITFPRPPRFMDILLISFYLNSNEVIFTHILLTIVSPAHHSSIW